jgi:hypothetical protein
VATDIHLDQDNLNTFNTVVIQLVSIEIKISYEDKCISLLCSLPDSWDSLVVAIGSNTTTLKFDEVVSSLLSEEMRQKNMEGQSTYALFARGCSQERNRSKSSMGDLSLREDLSLPKFCKGMLEMWENKGTTRSSVDPKLRKIRDLKNLLL